MNFNFPGLNKSKFKEELPAPKRISTPAGLRLSTILENGDQVKTPSKNKRFSFNKSPVIAEDAQEGSSTVDGSTLAASSNSQGYSYSIFSEKSATAVSGPANAHRKRGGSFMTRRGGWKRLALLVLFVLLALIALAVGLGVGLTHKHNQQNKSASPESDNSGSSPTPSGSGGQPSSSNNPSSNVTINEDFPVGNWSMVTFLNTVYTNCTSSAATWNCYPYTLYNDNPIQSEATFNWMISAGSKAGTYQISSTTNPFSLLFTNVSLTIKDQGNQTEHYWFQVTVDKSVTPLRSVTSDNSQSVCYFNDTTFTGYLYTKIASDYPPAGQSTGGSYPSWPYAVRAEQTMSGGDGIPTCYETNNGNLGQEIPINGTTFGDLCDCLYINYLTPIPNT